MLGIGRGGGCTYLSKLVSEADLALMRRIDELHLEHPFMGSTDAASPVVASRIATLMKKMGIEVRQDAASAKRDADYKVAIEKCGNFSGDAKDQCVEHMLKCSTVNKLQ